MDYLTQHGGAADSNTDQIDRREHPRYEPTETHAVLCTLEGRRFAVEVANVSAGGIGITYDGLMELTVGQHVQVTYCSATRSGQIRYTRTDDLPYRAGIQWV